MGIRSRLAHWLIKGADIGGWNVLPWQEGRAWYPDVSHRSLVDKYNSWVYACANKNAISCAQIPLRLYTAKAGSKTKILFPTKSVPVERMTYLLKSPTVLRYMVKAEVVEEIVEHPFLTLMQQVNEFMNQFDLLESLFLAQEITGNAYWHIVKQPPMDTPTEIWPLLPQYIKIIPSRKKFIERYEYSISPTEKHLINPEDMVHFKYISLKDVFYGYGPLQASILAADLSTSMNEYETNLFLNRAHPDWALTMPAESGKPTPDQRKRTEEEWNKKYRGTKKGGKLAFLFGGAELKQLSLSPKDMAFLQGRKATLKEIAAIFGVPLSKLTTEDVNRANAEAGDYSYMKDTILPRLRRVEQKLNEKLLPMFDERLFCAFDNPVPEDKEFHLKETTELLKVGYKTINEVRQEDGLDEVDYGNLPLLPMNIQPLGSTATVEPPIESVPPKSKAPRRLPPLNHPTNFINEPFVDAVVDYYSEVGEEILSAFDKDIEALERTLALNDRYSIKQSPDDLASGWFDMQKWSKRLAEKIEPFVRATVLGGGERALRSITAEQMFDPVNPKVMVAIEKHRVTGLQIANTDYKKLRATISKGLEAGEGIPRIRNRIEELYEGEIPRHRALVIARTETIWAWNEGAVQGYLQSGIVEKMQWVSSGDPRTCDWCIDLDGKIVGIEVNFFDKGDNYDVAGRILNFDYEDVGHPPLHSMCRCTIVPLIEGF